MELFASEDHKTSLSPAPVLSATMGLSYSQTFPDTVILKPGPTPARAKYTELHVVPLSAGVNETLDRQLESTRHVLGLV